MEMALNLSLDVSLDNMQDGKATLVKAEDVNCTNYQPSRVSHLHPYISKTKVCPPVITQLPSSYAYSSTWEQWKKKRLSRY
jgi:hypothetical protein